MKILITGTSCGIGKACAELFLQMNHEVIGFDIKAPIERLKDKFSANRLEPATNKGTVCGTFIETDDKTGLATHIEAIKITL